MDAEAYLNILIMLFAHAIMALFPRLVFLYFHTSVQISFIYESLKTNLFILMSLGWENDMYDVKQYPYFDTSLVLHQNTMNNLIGYYFF